MFFYWKRWFFLFGRLYGMVSVLIWLLLLFELSCVREYASKEALLLGMFTLLSAQGIVLLLVGGLTTAITIEQWEERGIRLLLNSIGIATQKILFWSFVPLLMLSCLSTLFLHIGGPFFAEIRDRVVTSNIIVGKPNERGKRQKE